MPSIKWKHFPRYWPFVRRIHRSPVNSSHKGQWRGALMFSLICGWINDWLNNHEAGDLRRYRAHYDVIVMSVEKRDSWCPGECTSKLVNHTIWIPNSISKVIAMYVTVNKSFAYLIIQAHRTTIQKPRPNYHGFAMLANRMKRGSYYFA